MPKFKFHPHEVAPEDPFFRAIDDAIDDFKHRLTSVLQAQLAGAPSVKAKIPELQAYAKAYLENSPLDIAKHAEVIVEVDEFDKVALAFKRRLMSVKP